LNHPRNRTPHAMTEMMEIEKYIRYAPLPWG